MRYLDEKADLNSQWGINFRKSLIITLSALLIVFLVFITVSVKRLKGEGYQQVIQLEEIDQTKQQIEKEPPPKQKIAEVIATEDEKVPDTVTIGTTELNIDSFVPPPPPDDDNIVLFVELQNPPEVVKRVDPDYPEMAKKGGIEGKILVEVIIGLDGKVESAKVVDAEPKGFFEEVSLKAAKQWVFTPALQRDKPVRVRYQIPFRFKLK